MTSVRVAYLLRIFYRRVLLIGEYILWAARPKYVFLVGNIVVFLENMIVEWNIDSQKWNIVPQRHWHFLSLIYRCGALSLGDQILSIDDTVIENSSYTPDEVMSFLNGPSDRGFTQIQMLPVHAINRKGLCAILAFSWTTSSNRVPSGNRDLLRYWNMCSYFIQS